MIIREHADMNYTITLTSEEKDLFQQEVDAQPFYGVVDIASLIGFNLACEFKILKQRYEK